MSPSSRLDRPRRTTWLLGRLDLVAALVVLVTGTLFAVVQPAVWGPDERAHLYRAWQVSEGGLLPRHLGDAGGIPRYGGQVPTALLRLAQDGTGRQWHRIERAPVLSADQVRRREPLLRAPVTGERATVEFVNTAAYAPVSYAPAVAGLWSARVLHLDAGGTVLAARLAGVAAAALAVFLAVRLLAGTGWESLVLVVAALPSATYQASVVSADTMTNLAALLLAAALVRLRLVRRPASPVVTWTLALSAVLVSVVKPSYAVLALLLALVPAARTRWTRRARENGGERRGPSRGLLAALLTSLLLAAGWLRVAGGTTAGMGVLLGPGKEHLVRPQDQLHHLVTHLTGLPGLAYRTIADLAPRYLRETFTQTGYQVEGSGTAMVLVLMALALAWFTAPCPSLSRRAATWWALVLLGCAGGIFAALYLSFTPVGYWEVRGVQGRYFLPLLLPTLVLLRAALPVRLVGERGTPPGDEPGRVGGWTVGLVVAAALLAVVKLALLTHVQVS